MKINILASVGTGLLILLSSQIGTAKVSPCDALTLYGNAAAGGLCKGLGSPANHWVCELAKSPDIHATVNAKTALHITVRTQGKKCEGNADLTGAWPAKLALNKAANATVCSVDIGNYVKRLNAVTRPKKTKTFCEDGFLKAQGNSKLTPKVASDYLKLCQLHKCP